ncbi:CopD family copper resistance protein [Neisseria sp. S1]|uniref:CopD family copper resistance protein n=1 Tax=Neisseria sp. S1 TaxID=3318354 RepID=UPI003A8646B7
MSAYAVAHIVHLFCAVIFVGGVFFEALVLSVLHTDKVGREVRREVDRALSYRAPRVMPWVVGLLFISGLAMAHRYAAVLSSPFGSAFAVQLALKILLAFSVLIHFLIAVVKMRRGTLTAAWSKYIHIAVLLHMIAIVVLAKTMFYLGG